MSNNPFGPDMFAEDLTPSDPTAVPLQPLPRAWSQSGVIESVKRAVVGGMREEFQRSSLGVEGQKFHIDIEYPTKPQHLPGVWVQFSIDKLQRGGLDMGVMTQDTNGVWGEVITWIFEGKITLTLAAESSKDRDRLADTIISGLAFARHPDLVQRNPKTNTDQLRGLINYLNTNPYVAITLNTDVIMSGGQTVTNAIPWAGNKLLYEDNYTITCQGQFNIRFAHDGLYTLTEVDIAAIAEASAPDYNPTQWLGQPMARYQIPPRGRF